MSTPNFFSAGSPFLAHPLLTAERAAQEIDFIAAELALPPGTRWLDVGCGFGRHSIELARRGYEVVGIDPAAAMIDAARTRAAGTAVAVDFRQAHAEQFTTKTPFDAAICLFTTLGQITEQGENSDLVNRVFAALKPGGHFVIEVPQRETAVSQLKPTDKFGNGERYTAVTRQYNPDDHSITEIFRLVSPEETRAYRLHYRLYNRAELTCLLTAAGFIVSAAHGDYAGTPLADEHPIMLMVGQKG